MNPSPPQQNPKEAVGRSAHPLRHLLGGKPKLSAPAFRLQTKSFGRATLLVRCYYACNLYFALALMADWTGLLNRNMPAPLWPVAWLTHVPLRTGIGAILWLYLLGALAAAIFPQKRWTRIIAFAGVFEWVAFNNSYGKIGHSMHLWTLVSALLIFLPDLKRGESPSRTQRQKFLLIFWACQAMIMLAYSMSGLGKVVVAIYQGCLGQMHAFSSNALAEVIAERLLETNSRSLLGPWLIDHSSVGWPLLLGAIYLELFAFLTVFRPSLHRFWACGLILFHIGSFLLLTVSFPQNCLLLALFFLSSPFHRDDENWRHTLADLPLLGRLFPRQCAS